MGDSQEFAFEGLASPSEAADALTRIAEGIRARALRLRPPGEVKLELKATRKSRKGTLEIEIGWKRRDATKAADAFD